MQLNYCNEFNMKCPLEVWGAEFHNIVFHSIYFVQCTTHVQASQSTYTLSSKLTWRLPSFFHLTYTTRLHWISPPKGWLYLNSIYAGSIISWSGYTFNNGIPKCHGCIQLCAPIYTTIIYPPGYTKTKDTSTQHWFKPTRYQPVQRPLTLYICSGNGRGTISRS